VVDVDEEDDSDEDVSRANEGISRIARAAGVSRACVCVVCGKVWTDWPRQRGIA
jgi:hypothetical protein